MSATAGPESAPVLLFDGDCGFCTATIDFVIRRARPENRAVAFQEERPSRWGIPEDQCREAVQWVDQDGGRRSGAEALATYVMSGRGPLRLLARACLSPIGRRLADPIYRFVAAHRHALPGATGACALRASRESDGGRGEDSSEDRGRQALLGEPGESWLRKQALPWLTSGGLPGLMLAVGILLVFMVPFVALLQPPPTRFGFQMYSGLGGVQISVQDVAGHARELSLADFAAQGRGELDWTKRLPEFVCDTQPQVVTVHVRQSGHERTLACAR